MRYLISLFTLFLALSAYGSGKNLQGAQWFSNDLLKVWSPPPISDTILGTSSTQTVINKSIDADNNTITDIDNNEIKSNAGIVYSKLNLTGSIVSSDISATAQIPVSKIHPLTASHAVVTDSSGILTTEATTSAQIGYLAGATSAISGNTQIATLTNKTINADDNQLANIDNNEIKAAAAIDASKIADGTVSSTEFQYINTLSSNAQTQLSAKLNASFGIVLDTLSYTNQGSDVAAPSAGFINTYTKTAGLFYRTPSNIRQVANLDEAQSLTNKTLDNSNTVTVRDDRFTMQDNGDATKQAVFQLSGITAGQTRTIAVADRNIEIGKFPTIQIFTSGSGTYNTPAGVTYIVVEMAGGGGGGGGGGTSGGGTGGNGGNTTFGTTLLVANGGAGGAFLGSTSVGGSASLGAATGIAFAGAAGQAGTQSPSGTTLLNGGNGGNSFFGGAGAGGRYSLAGSSATSNTGSGGGGAGTSSAGGSNSGAGGASGGYLKAWITSPNSTYSYAVGAAGTAGTAGTSGAAGGTGGSGVIIVTEYYN